MKKHLFSVVRVIVSVSLIAALLYMMRGSYRGFADIVRGMDALLFAFGLAGYVIGTVFASFRLIWILAAQDIALSFAEVFSLTYIGFFFNNFLPTSIGGDVVKAYYASNKRSRLINSFTAVFVDRAVGLMAMILVAFGALIFAGEIIDDKPLTYSIYVTTAASAVAVFFFMNKGAARRMSFLLIPLRRIEHKLKKLYDAIHQYRDQKRLLLKTIGISFLSQGIYFVSIYLLAYSIGTPIPMKQILLRMPIVCIAGILPSIGGLGVREGAMVVLFAPIVGKEAAFALSLLSLSMVVIVSIVGGLLYALSPQYRMNVLKTE